MGSIMKKTRQNNNKGVAATKKTGISRFQRLMRVFFIAVGILFISYLFNLVLFQWRDSSQMNSLQDKNRVLNAKIKHLQGEMDSIMLYVNHLHEKDEKIYRILLGENPMDSAIWQAGTGGYAYPNQADSISSPLQFYVDKIKAKMYVQNASFDLLMHHTLSQMAVLESQPKISPLMQNDFGRISSSFGFRKHPIFKVWKFHKGLDITARKGSPVYATAGGTVIQAANIHDGYGKKVVIDHGHGYKTVYAHLNSIKVKRGEKVALATKIGEVGSTGRSNGSHLHYEVRHNDKNVNPIRFLYRDFTTNEFARLTEQATILQ